MTNHEIAMEAYYYSINVSVKFEGGTKYSWDMT